MVVVIVVVVVVVEVVGVVVVVVVVVLALAVVVVVVVCVAVEEEVVVVVVAGMAVDSTGACVVTASSVVGHGFAATGVQTRPKSCSICRVPAPTASCCSIMPGHWSVTLSLPAPIIAHETQPL